MEEANITPKEQRAMCVNLSQKDDKRFFVGTCEEYRIRAEVTRSSSSEGIGGGRIKRLGLYEVEDTDDEHAILREVVNYDGEWKTFPHDSYTLLAYTFVRHSIEEIPLSKLVD